MSHPELLDDLIFLANPTHKDLGVAIDEVLRAIHAVRVEVKKNGILGLYPDPSLCVRLVLLESDMNLVLKLLHEIEVVSDLLIILVFF